MREMLAAVFKGNGVLEVEKIPVPKISAPTDVLIRVRAASICGSDIHGLHVPPGQIFTPNIVYGHEFFGEVVETGERSLGFQVGDVVAVNPCMPCGECFDCVNNRSNLCVNPYHYGQTCDGGFAEYALVDAGQLYHLPKDISPDIAAQTEPLACVMSGMVRIQPMPTDRVLLYGAGPIGLTFIRALKLFGVQNLAVVAKGAARIRQAKECGADLVIDSQAGDVKEALLSAWGCLADVAIDAVGTGPIFSQILELMNARGRVLLFGYNRNAMSQVPPFLFTSKELTVTGVLGKDFPRAIAMMQNKELGLDQFISHRFALKDIQEAFRLLMNKEGCRIIVYPDGVFPA